ncbi:putative esterase of the alpha-beta hydrolase superfamily [Xenococcus sp. PCC 7305]|uniref:patatin-like phospholipase family protein n=1 Tax=Xenococcus sp. PCC 7305 TaxID=102125 RepID=UPI0002ACBF6B|nr:patatin-like phospholipase family protein [Xenococcus sp. PCC 7305]ELS01782.1 putative esterase of the alpha-beta hydrolase superfamily [Xenococcus sp. PCC 7305]
MTQTTDANNQNPLTIGLALSGGGYRAAGFHLGVLSYLDRVGLLSQLKMLSTVSGGTFTGAKYILSLAEKQNFSEFYGEYSRLLKTTNLIKLGLEKLSKQTNGDTSKRQDLITSVADVYAETFFKKENGEAYLFGEILEAEILVEEVTFNATEFRSGIAFRFQSSASGRIGNGKISIPKAAASKIRIADIVAASSCFPGGFEPLAFPDDFHWIENKIPTEITERVAKTGQGAIALMDGGVFDNQGIGSILLAEKRKSPGKDDSKLDMFIISDVDQKLDSLFEFPEKIRQNIFGKLTLNFVAKSLNYLTGFLVLSWLAMGFKITEEIVTKNFGWIDGLVYLFPVLLLIAISLLNIKLLKARQFIEAKVLPEVPQVGKLAWNDLKKITINQLLNGLNLRLSSLVAMTSFVFMKQIRRMGYNAIYEGEEAERIIANYIYDLKQGNRDAEQFLAKFPELSKPSPELQQIIDDSSEVPTTLWFNDQKELPNLIICGQASICYNLMRYIARRKDKDPNFHTSEMNSLWDVLVQDWNSLGQDPHAFL